MKQKTVIFIVLLLTGLIFLFAVLVNQFTNLGSRNGLLSCFMNSIKFIDDSVIYQVDALQLELVKLRLKKVGYWNSGEFYDYHNSQDQVKVKKLQIVFEDYNPNYSPENTLYVENSADGRVVLAVTSEFYQCQQIIKLDLGPAFAEVSSANQQRLINQGFWKAMVISLRSTGFSDSTSRTNFIKEQLGLGYLFTINRH